MQTVIDTEPTRHAGVPLPSRPPRFQPRRRFLRVWTFFLGVVIHIYIWDIFLMRFALTRWYARRTAIRRWVMIARRFRGLAVKLGGMHIKLGQFLSSRADIIPDEVRHELAGLQDEVPPAPAGHALERIFEELGALPNELFQQFEAEAVAAASLGQVHYATLHDGREVAVKVQRPYIDEIIEIDLGALSWIVRLIKDYPPLRRRVKAEGLHQEFSRVLRRELDYVQEARNAELFRVNFAEMPGIYVPQPFTEMTTRRVLVMERISGIKVNNLEALKQAGVNLHELAERLNQTYLKQFFVDGFFHADPHPGNLFVRIEPTLPLSAYTNGRGAPDRTAEPSPNGSGPASGTPFTLIFIDFGMVGHMPPQTMETVRDGVIGLATNDAERIVEALDRLNMILPGADKRPVVRAIQVMLRYSYNRTVRELNNMDVEAIFDETQDIIYDLPFQIPQDLLYLGRAMSMVGGLATMLDPDINLFVSLRPFARQMLEQERNGDLFGRIQQEVRELSQILLTLPRQMDTYYKSANRGDLELRSDFGRLERGIRRVERSTDRLAGGIVATGLFLGGVQLRLRGLDKEARGAWWGALAALIWMLRPRGDNPR